MNLQNDVMGDPELRKHYQIWHFMYPPGLPIAFTAQLFRAKLQEIYRFFDPHDQYPALHHSVIIAHSMGGLLAHTVVSDSGDQLWHLFFQKAPDELTLSTEVRQQLDDTLRFQRSPLHYAHYICGRATPRQCAVRESGGRSWPYAHYGAHSHPAIHTPRARASWDGDVAR